MADGDAPSPVVQQHHFPCAGCGADLRFSARDGAMACAHCGVTRALPAPATQTVDQKTHIDEGLDLSRLPESALEEVRLAHCPDCGADVEFAPNLHSTECPFCTTPVVVDTGPARRIKPQGVLPFEVPLETARDSIRSWLGSHFMAPDALAADATEHKGLQGVYVPVWTFDADLDVRYAGKSTKRVLTKDMKWEKGARRETAGRVQWRMEDVHIHASVGLPEAEVNRLNPWDLSKLRPYGPAYLSGFRAEAYQSDLAAAKTALDGRLQTLVNPVLYKDMGGYDPKVTETVIDVGDLWYRPMLLPVWVYAYRFRDKVYRVTVNGQTGEVRGEYPISKVKKVVRVVVGGLMIAAMLTMMLVLSALGQ